MKSFSSALAFGVAGTEEFSYKIANIYIAAHNEDELQRKFDRCAEALPFEFDEA